MPSMNDLCWNETRSFTTTHLCCHLSTDLRDVTCKPSTHSKNQDIGFFEQVLGLQISVETGELARPLTTAITDQLMTQ